MSERNELYGTPCSVLVTRTGDGTDRLCRVLYGRKPMAKDYLGGSDATMLYDAASALEMASFLNFEDLSKALPKDVIKKLSIHDIKRICDNFNQQRNATSRNKA